MITEEEGRGYSKRKHATFMISSEDVRRDGVRQEWLAVKVVVYSAEWINGQEAPLATDFYWEGASIL